MGSHVGLIYNRAVYRAIAGALCVADKQDAGSSGTAANDRGAARS
jgi:hypothetical protein